MEKSEETFKIIEDFPELNVRVREATEGILNILEDVKLNFGTEATDYSNYEDEYERLCGIVDLEIKNYKGVKRERVVLILKNIKDGMEITEQGHKLGYDTLDSLDLMIELSEPDRWSIQLKRWFV